MEDTPVVQDSHRHPRFLAGDIEIRPLSNLIVVNGEERYLRQQTMQVLAYLLEHRGELVSKDALITAIWNGTAVTDDAIVQCVVEIRKALGDDPRKPRFVRTVPKGGYSFIGPLTPILEQPALPASVGVAAAPTPHRQVPRWALASAAAAVVVLALVAAFAWRGSAAAIEWPVDPGKVRVIVLPFDNTSGDSDLDWLRIGLGEMVVTGLARSPGLNLLAPSQLARFSSEEATNLQSALDVAKRANAAAIVTGTFTAVGDALRVDARVYQADGTLAGTESLMAARREVVLTQVDRLAEGLSRILGQPLDKQQSALHFGDVMTTNLAAYREYSLGVEKATALQSDAALDHFNAAVTADPNFAMAHARIGYTYAVSMGWAARAEPFLAKAFQMSDRLRDKDRLSILAWYALAKLDYEGALSPLRTLIDRFPDDLESYWLLARTLRGEERWDETERVLLAGLRINPNAKDLHNELRAVYSATERLALAKTEAEKYVALSPNEPNAYDSLGMAYQQMGQYDEALRSYQRSIALDPGFDIAVYHIGNVYAEQGRYRDALVMYRRYTDMMRFPERRLHGLQSQAWIHYVRGQYDEAWRLGNLQEDVPNGLRLDLAMIALARGDRERFRREIQIPIGISNRGARFPRIFEAYARGWQAEVEGRQDEALAQFRQAIKHAPVPWSFPTYDDCLAEALFRYQRYADATAEYRRLLSLNPSAARARFRLAQIADRENRPADAEAEYRKFLALWSQADADAPEMVAARAWLKTRTRATATASH
jgi:DNA-binding winged helix-turn-helix (wHTH) protein/tetratricopeptide (TPR) repeat protein/TolB-like protein